MRRKERETEREDGAVVFCRGEDESLRWWLADEFCVDWFRSPDRMVTRVLMAPA